jgi:hypothetical protein
MENKEPSRDDNAKQEAAGEEYKQEAEQFLELHRQDKVFTPSDLFAGLGAYLLFVGAVTGVGVLASYSHHETTANVFLVVSVPLLLIAPIGVIWYLFVTFRKKPQDKPDGKQSLLDKIYQTAIWAFLVRITNTRIAKTILYVLYVTFIGFQIVDFPRRPRFSLALIAFYMLYLVGFAVSDVVSSLKKEHTKDTLMLAKASIATFEVFTAQQAQIASLQSFVGNLTERHDKLVEAHLESNEKNLAAIVALNRLVRVVANIEEPDQLDAPPEEDQETNAS